MLAWQRFRRTGQDWVAAGFEPSPIDGAEVWIFLGPPGLVKDATADTEGFELGTVALGDSGVLYVGGPSLGASGPSAEVVYVNHPVPRPFDVSR